MFLPAQNCKRSLPHFICYFANLCGYISLTCWFCTLLFQVIKNYKIHNWPSGLSILWSIANFSASLFNVFFVFGLNLPWFTKLLAVYMPIVEFLLILQYI